MKKVEGVEEGMIEYDDELQESDAAGACPSVGSVGRYLETLKNQGFYSKLHDCHPLKSSNLAGPVAQDLGLWALS